jgi:hypothetical protein
MGLPYYPGRARVAYQERTTAMTTPEPKRRTNNKGYQQIRRGKTAVRR